MRSPLGFLCLLFFFRFNVLVARLCESAYDGGHAWGLNVVISFMYPIQRFPDKDKGTRHRCCSSGFWHNSVSLMLIFSFAEWEQHIRLITYTGNDVCLLLS